MCYRNQGTRISGDELKPWAALLCSMALDGKKSAFLHSRASSPEKGMQESRAMLSNLLKWCFNRPIPARSPHSGANVNPRMGIQDQGSSHNLESIDFSNPRGAGIHRGISPEFNLSN